MLSIDGAVKVVDFGIATLAGGNPDSFGDDTITGTITYMSPEQFVSHSVDAQSDIFSMGLVFFVVFLFGIAIFGSVILLDAGFFEGESPSSSSR